jgi:PAS domain S-box-containing protein
MPVAIVFVDIKTARILEFNKKACEQLGYTREEFSTLSLSDIDVIETAAETRARIDSVIRKGNGEFETRQRTKQGEIRDIHVTAQLIETNSGTSYQCIWEDVTERKQAETSLRESEQSYRLLVNSIPNTSILLFDRDMRYKIVGGNENEKVGIETSTIEGKTLREAYPKEVADFFEPLYKKAFQGVPTEVEMEYQGNTYLQQTLPILGKNHEILGATQIVTNITERKLAESDIRTSREGLLWAEKVAQLGNWTYDPVTQQPIWSEGMFSILGLDPKFGAPNYDEHRKLIHPDDWQVFDTAVTASVTQGKPYNLEVRIIRPDGELRTIVTKCDPQVDVSGKVIELKGIIQDITEATKLEEVKKFLLKAGTSVSGGKFFESLAKYLSETLNMGYVCIDRLEGDGMIARTVAVYNNGAFESNVTYALKDTPCADVVGKSVCCFPKDVRQSFPKDADLQALKAESYVGTTLVGYNGKPIGLIAVIGRQPLVNKGFAENVLGLVAIRAAGEMEREQAEIENQKLREKAELSSRLAAIGEMAAGIAHEINNPLTSVVGFSDLLMEKQDLSDDIREEIKIINEGSKRVKSIVSRMLTFAHQTKPARTITDINEIINSTLDMRSYVLKTANIQVMKHFDSALPKIFIDPGQIQQVVLNLILNAEYAMKKAHGKGTLIVTTDNVANHIRISFKDDGAGMDQETRKKLFNPFFTTKQVNEGTGLGLSLSRSLILEHGGTIEVDSELGKGATFIITLPINQPSEEAETKTETTTQIPLGNVRAARILVVDDEEPIRKLVSMILAKGGHTVETTGDAREALVKLEGASYGAVLMDIRMPGLSGMELYNDIKTRRPEIAGRFIFITGDTSDESTRAFLEENKLSYITKPFDRNILVQKVNGILERE